MPIGLPHFLELLIDHGLLQAIPRECQTDPCKLLVDIACLLNYLSHRDSEDYCQEIDSEDHITESDAYERNRSQLRPLMIGLRPEALCVGSFPDDI